MKVPIGLTIYAFIIYFNQLRIECVKAGKLNKNGIFSLLCV